MKMYYWSVLNLVGTLAGAGAIGAWLTTSLGIWGLIPAVAIGLIQGSAAARVGFWAVQYARENAWVGGGRNGR
jgi:hypothetical protein